MTAPKSRGRQRQDARVDAGDHAVVDGVADDQRDRELAQGEDQHGADER